MGCIPWGAPHGLHPMGCTAWVAPHGLHPMGCTGAFASLPVPAINHSGDATFPEPAARQRPRHQPAQWENTTVPSANSRIQPHAVAPCVTLSTEHACARAQWHVQPSAASVCVPCDVEHGPALPPTAHAWIPLRRDESLFHPLLTDIDAVPAEAQTAHAWIPLRRDESSFHPSSFHPSLYAVHMDPPCTPQDMDPPPAPPKTPPPLTAIGRSSGRTPSSALITVVLFKTGYSATPPTFYE